MAEKTVKINKDRKHKVTYIYGQKGNKDYAYVCGPRTRNLWYKVTEDFGKTVIAIIPEGV